MRAKYIRVDAKLEKKMIRFRGISLGDNVILDDAMQL